MQCGLRQQGVDRLAGRLTCPKDQSTYHPRSIPPRAAGLCDVCGTGLVQRPDDTADAIQKRLDAYARWTAPVADYYEARGLLRRVDAVGRPEEVFARVGTALA